MEAIDRGAKAVCEIIYHEGKIMTDDQWQTVCSVSVKPDSIVGYCSKIATAVRDADLAQAAIREYRRSLSVNGCSKIWCVDCGCVVFDLDAHNQSHRGK